MKPAPGLAGNLHQSSAMTMRTGAGAGLQRGRNPVGNLPHLPPPTSHLPSNRSSRGRLGQIPQVANIQVSDASGSVREQSRLEKSKQAATRTRQVLFPPSPKAQDPLLQPPQPLCSQLLQLNALKTDLSRCSTLSKKVNILSNNPSVRAFLQDNRAMSVVKCLQRLGMHEQYVLLCLPAMSQEHVLSVPAAASPSSSSSSSSSSSMLKTKAALTNLAALLTRVDHFYDSIGGLVGYQAKSIELILEGTAERQPQQLHPHHAHSPQVPEVRYHVPHALDLAREGSRELGQQVALQGLMALPHMAEIYPVGGAGDRLGLECERTGECLPAAMLPYNGRTMLEGLIRDLQAREHLYYKLTGKQVTTPVAIMTSDAKGNHTRMLQLMESMDWFGRGKDSFRLFRQPLVPVISVEDGQWLLTSPLRLMAKPGGHGAIWKLMRDEGIFAWLQQQGRQAALVRQISNPMAGTDTTLLALAGRGQQQGSSFGFMSCDRTVGAAEGCNALQERRTWDGGAWKYEYGYTNIEYTEFGRLGMSDLPTEHNSTTSKFPANTNVLYVNLHAASSVVEQAVSEGSSERLMPGLIFNRKKAIVYKDPLRGTITQRMRAGRMECTMQNIADFMTDRRSEPLQPQDPACNQLSTFLVYNERRKVTSSAKKRREPGSLKISQTPDGSFYDLQRNAWHLLQQCGVAVPPIVSVEQYLQKGPGFLFLFHPSLGPLWDVISQKVRGGELAPGSELVLEVAEASLDSVSVEGSLLICASNTIGHKVPAAACSSESAVCGLQQSNHAAHHSSSSGGSSGSSSSSSKSTGVLNNITSSSSILSSSRSSPPPRTARTLDSEHALRPSSSLHAKIVVGSTQSASGHTAAEQQQQQQQQQQHSIRSRNSCRNSKGMSTSAGSGATGLAAAAGAGAEAGVGAGSSQRLVYSSSCGRVRLSNVRVKNQGVDWTAPDNVFWKHQVVRREALRVQLHGHAEFEARNVTIQGSHCFEVPDGHRMVVSQAAAGGVHVELTPLVGGQPTWHWDHSLDEFGKVKLKLATATCAS